jgi:hypothetical protein
VGTNGFPRQANLANGKSELKILVLPIIFEEISFTDTDLANLQNALKQTSDFFARTSFNRVKITFEIPTKNLAGIVRVSDPRSRAEAVKQRILPFRVTGIRQPHSDEKVSHRHPRRLPAQRA